MDQDHFRTTVLRPYEKLVQITICGTQFSVPENNLLLRAFQYLCPEEISMGRYCWNEECQYCRVTLSREGEEKKHQALSCKMLVEDGMTIHEISTELNWNLRSALRPTQEDTPRPDYT